MNRMTRLSVLTLVAVALGTAPATAHDGHSWSAPTTSGGPAAHDVCPRDPADGDGRARGTEPLQIAVGASLTAAAGTGSPNVPAGCAALTAAEAGALPEAPEDAGLAAGSGNAAVLFVAGMGALAVTGSAVVAHRRNTDAH